MLQCTLSLATYFIDTANQPRKKVTSDEALRSLSDRICQKRIRSIVCLTVHGKCLMT